jgi:hypothetical protein
MFPLPSTSGRVVLVVLTFSPLRALPPTNSTPGTGSLHPVAIGAVVEETKRLERASGEGSRIQSEVILSATEAKSQKDRSLDSKEEAN